MIPGYIIFLIFFLVLYAFTNENRQIAATASALREIWSGGCRLTRCLSECSGLSGLGGASAAGTSGAAASHDCICDFCPCALIDSVFRSCGPASLAYNTAVEILSEFYYSVLKTRESKPDGYVKMGDRHWLPSFLTCLLYTARTFQMAELYLHVHSALECGVSCQRPSQLLNLSRLDSDENFNFDGTSTKEKGVEKEFDDLKGKEKTINKIIKKISAISNTELNLSKLGIEKGKFSLSVKSTKESKMDVGKEERQMKAGKQNSGNINAQCSKDATAGAPSPSTSSGHCPRCVEKGRVCIGSCPKANVDNKK